MPSIATHLDHGLGSNSEIATLLTSKVGKWKIWQPLFKSCLIWPD